MLLSINRKIISGLNPTGGEVKLLYFFSVLLCGKFKNPIDLFNNCQYAAGDKWYILKHYLMIKGCHCIPLQSFLDTNYFCWFHNRDWGYYHQILTYDFVVHSSVTHVGLLIHWLLSHLPFYLSTLAVAQLFWLIHT